jgi:hypothetical protein
MHGGAQCVFDLEHSVPRIWRIPAAMQSGIAEKSGIMSLTSVSADFADSRRFYFCNLR